MKTQINPQNKKCRISYTAITLAFVWCLLTVLHYVYVHNTYISASSLSLSLGDDADYHDNHTTIISEEERMWLMMSGVTKFDSTQYHRGKKIAARSRSLSMDNNHVSTEESDKTSLKLKANTVVGGKVERESEFSSSDRPRLYLHIGPPKMGTTTLQHYLEQDDDDGILALSNFTYVQCPGLQKMYSPITGQDFEHWIKFQSCLNKAKSKGPHINAVYSQEVFGKFFTDSPLHWKYLKEVTSDWHVIIVVSYRRFFEWLPSYYYQNNRLMNCMGKCKPPTFHEYFETMKKDKTSYYVKFWGGVLGTCHPAEALIDKFGRHFDDVMVHNIHEEPDNLVANFYCNIMNAKESCLHRRTEGLEVSKNIGSTLNYNLLADASKKKKLVPKKLSRFVISKATQSFQESQGKNEHDFPLTCIDQEDQDWLLNTSLDFEHRIVPEWFLSDKGEKEHRSKFDSAMSKHKFCNLDVEQTISDPLWRNFFITLVEQKSNTEKNSLLTLNIGDEIEYFLQSGTGVWTSGVVIEKNWIGTHKYVKIEFNDEETHEVVTEAIKIDASKLKEFSKQIRRRSDV